MEIMEQVTADMKAALKNREKIRLGALRMLLAESKNRRIELQRELAEDDILQLISRMVKQRQEAAEQFAAGGRDELADKEKAEVEVLKAYLPASLTEAELEALVRAAIAEAGAESKKDMGKVMKIVMPKVAGRADGKLVNQMVSRLLA